MDVLTVLAIAVFAHGVVSKRLATTIITAPMVFVTIGLFTGPEALGLAEVDLGSEEVIVLVELTLSIVLFSDAVRVDPGLLRRFVGIPARMLGVGLPLIVAGGSVAGHFVLGLEWADAALLGAILAATDAALGQAVLADASVPARIRGALNVESGLNDGLALPAVTLFAAITVAESASEPATFWIRFVVEQVGFGALAGAVVGFGGGWLLVRADRAGWVDGINGQVAALSLAGLAYALAHGLGGNTFIAAFVAGAAFRVAGDKDAEHLTEFTEDGGHLFASITFVVFGNALLGPTLGELSPSILLYVVVSLTVVRMAPIALSLVGTHLRPPTVLFLGWFGPRGLASILFTLTVLEDTGRTVEDELFVVVAWTVFVSVLVHGATAASGAAAYGRWYGNHRAGVYDETTITEGPVHDTDADVGPRPRWMPRRTRQ